MTLSQSVSATELSEVEVLITDIKNLRFIVAAEEERGIEHSPIQVEWAKRSNSLRLVIQNTPKLLTNQKLEELSSYFPFILQTQEGRKLLREYRVKGLSLIDYYLGKMRSIADDPSLEFDPKRVTKYGFMVHLVEVIHAYLLDKTLLSADELHITKTDLNPSFQNVLFFPLAKPETLSSFLAKYRNRSRQGFKRLLEGNLEALKGLERAIGPQRKRGRTTLGDRLLEVYHHPLGIQEGSNGMAAFTRDASRHRATGKRPRSSVVIVS